MTTMIGFLVFGAMVGFAVGFGVGFYCGMVRANRATLEFMKKVGF